MTLKILSLAIALLSALVPTLALTGCNSYSGAGPSVNDAAELACARLQQGDLTGARESAEAGIRLARSAQEKAAFFVLVAQTYGIEGKYRAAAEAALAGQQIAPTSIELAHVRLEYFSRAGDDAQERAADRHLRSFVANDTAKNAQCFCWVRRGPFPSMFLTRTWRRNQSDLIYDETATYFQETSEEWSRMDRRTYRAILSRADERTNQYAL